MKWTRNTVLSAALFAPAFAQMSPCDKYTTALLKDNTGANQYTLLTLIVNTALIGNYTQPNHNKVNGILVPGQYNGKNVTLLPYFNGGLLSTNRQEKGVAVNFIDGGGAIPLAQNKPANDNTSNQYKLITHLYGYFGALLGCSQVGKDGFPGYGGSTRMYETHKFMNLDPDEMGYFIQEVGLSAASFGVTTEDITAVAMALNNAFNMRCSPKAAIPPSAKPDFQAICINSACPTVATGAVCTQYNKMSGSGVEPATASSTSGPQLTDLAPQLMSIAAGKVTPMAPGGGVASFTTSPVTITSGGSTITTVTSVPIGGAVTTTGQSVVTSGSMTMTVNFTSVIPASVVSSVTTVITSNGSTITSVMPMTEANPATEAPPSSTESVITSVITSGSSTITSLITTSVPASSSKSGNAAPVQTAAVGMMAIVGAAGIIGQML